MEPAARDTAERMERSNSWSRLIGAQFKRARRRRNNASFFIPVAVQDALRPTTPATAAAPATDTAPARSAEDRARWRSKLPIAWTEDVQSATRPPESDHARRVRSPLVAGLSCLLPDSASAHLGKAKRAPLAVLPGRRAEPPRAMSCERLPALCVDRPTSRSKNDKAAADFVFDPARVMSPKKFCAFYAPPRCGQEFVAGELCAETAHATACDINSASSDDALLPPRCFGC